MEGILDRRSGRIFTDLSPGTVLADSFGWPRVSATDRTEPRQGMPEVRSLREHAEEERRAPTPNDPPKRVGRLETPGPPVSVIQGASPRAKGRGASLGEMPGATRGTGVRVRSTGKQKSVERIGFALRALPQGSPQEGKPATRKPPRSADAEGAAHLQPEMDSERRRGPVP